MGQATVATRSSSTEQRPIPRPSELRRRRAAPETRTEPVVAPLVDSKFLTAIGPVGVLVAALAFGAAGLTGTADSTLGVVIAPGYAVIAFLILNKTLHRTQGAGFISIVFAGLALRLILSVPRLAGGVDSVVYQQEGVRLAEHFRNLDFSVTTGRSIPGTGAVRYFVGLVNVLTGSNFVATFLFFTMIAFAGQVFFLVGIRPLLTTRQFRVFAILLMAWPSMAYWPSSIGKEAVVMFGIGLTTFGASRLYERRLDGSGYLLIGLLSIGLVRPHVALIVLIGLLIGLFSRSDETRSRAIAHLLALVFVVIGAMWLTSVSASLFGLEQLDGIEDLNAALDFAEARTSQDRAAFDAPRVDSPGDYPWAFVTVLFRPFPWEATSGFALLSAAEGALLLGLCVLALPGLVAEGRKILRSGQLLNAAAFTAVFVFLFSAIGNFGILSRQRAQLIPFVLIFVAIGVGFRGYLPMGATDTQRSGDR